MIILICQGKIITFFFKDNPFLMIKAAFVGVIIQGMGWRFLSVRGVFTNPGSTTETSIPKEARSSAIVSHSLKTAALLAQ